MSPSTPVIHLDSRLPALLSLVIRPIAVTLGRHIFIRRGVTPTDVLLRHEAVHVSQFLELGLLRFLWYYLTDWLKAWWRLRDGAAAYRAIRFEQEARFLERFSVPWAEVATVRPPRPQSWESFTLPGRL